MAQDIFASTNGLFDVCYNDADKGDYPQIWAMAKQRIRQGDFILPIMCYGVDVWHWNALPMSLLVGLKPFVNIIQ